MIKAWTARTSRSAGLENQFKIAKEIKEAARTKMPLNSLQSVNSVVVCQAAVCDVCGK